ncbi:MAG: NTP transferase domain-containing protein [Pseudomonadota bacterium]
MDALILAAGFGSRLAEAFPSKPLATVRGVSLLELSVRQLVQAGVRRIVVATGHRAQEVEAAIEDIAQRWSVEILARRVDDWSKPNGFSVLAGAAELRDHFYLVMCDHILSTSILCGLREAKGKDHDVTLAVDRRTSSPLIDPDDATWVGLRDNGFIERIGKHISERHAVDCGAFVATPALAKAIEKAIEKGLPGSLSDGMQILADLGRASTFDIGDAWWIDVDDPAAHSLAEAQIEDHIDIAQRTCSAAEQVDLTMRRP